MKILSKEEFDNLTPYLKGYAVYMMGSREDQPNVPENYSPSETEKEEYEKGNFKAMLNVMDEEDMVEKVIINDVFQGGPRKGQIKSSRSTYKINNRCVDWYEIVDLECWEKY